MGLSIKKTLRSTFTAAAASVMFFSTAVQLPENSISAEDSGYYFHDTFDGDNFDWSGRGDATVEASTGAFFAGSGSLYVQDRSSAWNGAYKSLDSSVFVPGNSYSFSINVMFKDGGKSDTFYMKLQYVDSSGENVYSPIAEATTLKGEWVQLINTSYTIPSDATEMQLYIETADSINNFYLDEAFGADSGTQIEGPKPVKLIIGDVTCDGEIDVYDVIASRKGIKNGFSSTTAALAADVNQDDTPDENDIIQLQDYILGRIDSFTVVEKPFLSMADFTEKIKSQVVEFEPNDSHSEKAGVQYGTIKGSSYWSTTCNREKKYNILLPAGYSETQTYPVLYVLHGYYEDPDRMIIKGNNTMYTRQIIGNAIASGDAKDMIVVFPDVYSSATQSSVTGMDDANNAAYDNFINDLIKDLMPHIEETYSIKTGKENTAITGFSMGGRESLLIGMKRPDLFGYVGSICAAPGVTGTFNWSDDNSPYLLLMTAGSDDTVVYNSPVDYHDKFTSNGVPHIWHYVNGGYHGDNSIHAHLYNFVRFVFQAGK